MIIIGVDPGTLITGFSVIKIAKGSPVVLACNVLKIPKNYSMPNRLKKIYEGLVSVIKQFKPDEFAIESSFYGKNAQTALKIGYARGVSILAAIMNNIPTTEYSPREVKRAITGNGSATKQQVQFILKSQLGLEQTPKNLDASDALAVALCHSYRRKNLNLKNLISLNKNNRTSKSWSSFVKDHPELVIRKI